jgi:hypothetical protein
MEKMLFFLALFSVRAGAGLILSIQLRFLVSLFIEELSLEAATNSSLVIGMIVGAASLLYLGPGQSIKIYFLIMLGSAKPLPL